MLRELHRQPYHTHAEGDVDPPLAACILVHSAVWKKKKGLGEAIASSGTCSAMVAAGKRRSTFRDATLNVAAAAPESHHRALTLRPAVREKN